MQGVVVKYNHKKGYGFIRTEEEMEDIFVHHSAILNAHHLEVGQAVEFEIKTTAKGLAAKNLKAGAKQHSPYLIFGVISVIMIGAIFSYLYTQINPLFAYLIAINISTFLLYGYDKLIAPTKLLRIPEWNLHAIALLGGSPAGLLAQKFFRHKSIKSSFQLIYWIIVLLQVGLIFWLRD